MKLVYGAAFLTASLIMGSPCLAQSDTRMITCTDDREQDCLDRVQGIASRSGDLLTLRFLNGEKKTFRSHPEACQDGDVALCVNSTVAAYLPNSGHVAIRHRYYEGSDGELVNLNTGESVSFDAPPEFAPDGKRFAVVPDTSHYDFNYDFAIWSMQSGQPFEEFRNSNVQDSAGHWFLDDWVGDGELIFTVEFLDGKSVYVSVRLTEGKWRFTQPSPSFNATGR